MTGNLDLLHIHDNTSSKAVENTELVLHGAAAVTGPRMPLVVSIAGHTDAGSLSEQLSEALLDGLEHKHVASFDIDELFDYRQRRPQATFTENRLKDFQGPELELYEMRDAIGRRFLLLHGDEPDFKWERVISTISELVNRLQVHLVVNVDSFGLPTPHTRPLGVTAHGNREDLIEGISSWSPQAKIETGLAQMLEIRLDEQGQDVVGYTIHVPHYLANGKYPQVAVAAVEYIGMATGLMLPSDKLREAARGTDQEITRQVQQSPEVQHVVSQLESNYDQHAEGSSQRSLLIKDDEDLPDAEELGAAVEEFLRARPEDSIPGWVEAEAQRPGNHGPAETHHSGSSDADDAAGFSKKSEADDHVSDEDDLGPARG